VILVLGGLVFLVMKSIPCRTQYAIEGKVPHDLKYIHEMVDLYASDHDGRWPASMDDLLKKEVGSQPYLRYRLLDPWKNEYLFLPPITPDGRPRIGTLGKDVRPGGKGEDADYDDWMIWNGRAADDS